MKLLLLFFLFFSSNSLAQYLKALPNHNLKEELEAQPDRLIDFPHWFDAAVDGHIYMRNLGSKDYYHGVGYWNQLRTQSTLNNHFAMNTRSVFYSGSHSFGYTSENNNYHLFSFTGYLPISNKNLSISAIARDLERQTIGSGLILEDREMVGLLLRVKYNDISFKLVSEGTNGYNYSGDLYFFELNYLEKAIGIGTAIWMDDSIDQNEGSIAKNYHYIFSKLNFSNNAFLKMELGTQNNKIAYMAALAIKTKSITSKFQYRHYDNDFLNEFIGRTLGLYASLDQLDIAFTNPHNILSRDNNVDIFAFHFDFDSSINEIFSVNGQSEVGQFKYKVAIPVNYFFYRLAIKYKPIKGRIESLSFYYSNKILKSSYSTPPKTISYSFLKFISEPFIGIDARFRF